MTAIADPLIALRRIVADDDDIKDLVGDRVFNDGIDESISRTWKPNQAEKTVTLSSAGGIGQGMGARSYMNSNTIRVDVRCTGENSLEARKVFWAVYGFMKSLTRIQDSESGVMFDRVISEGGPIRLRESKVNWDYVLGTWVVTFGEVLIQ